MRLNRLRLAGIFALVSLCALSGCGKRHVSKPDKGMINDARQISSAFNQLVVEKKISEPTGPDIQELLTHEGFMTKPFVGNEVSFGGISYAREFSGVSGRLKAGSYFFIRNRAFEKSGSDIRVWSRPPSTSIR